MTFSDQTIVVGVDGSAGSAEAVLWAVGLAAHRGLRLRVVHALRLTVPWQGVGLVEAAALVDSVRDSGERILRDAVRLAREVDENVAITTDMPTEPPVPLLIGLSRSVRMVVVGHTGVGGFSDMLLGSTAAAVVSHAHCPVMVVRGRFGPAGVPEEGPVVVGIDGSPVSEVAVALAFDEASLRGVPLIALHAWKDDTYGITDGTGRYPTARDATNDATKDSEQLLLAERLAGWQERYPDVEVRRELVGERPRHALLEWSARAQLVVVGSRGRGGFRSMLLGSTSQALVHHAQCPVLVARPLPGE
jgi:nucleotide-binding universal stress UspA family protein